jgi:hypothetical protein
VSDSLNLSDPLHWDALSSLDESLALLDDDLTSALSVLLARMNTIVFDFASVSHLSRGKSLVYFAWLVVRRN